MRMSRPSVKAKKKEGQPRAPISADLPPRPTAPTFPPFQSLHFLLLLPPISNPTFPIQLSSPSSICHLIASCGDQPALAPELNPPPPVCPSVCRFHSITINPHAPETNLEMFVRCSSTSAHLDLPNHHPCSCPPVMYHIDVSVSIPPAVSSCPVDECACGVRDVN